MSKLDNLQTPEWVWKPLGPFHLDPCAGTDTSIGLYRNWCIENGDDGLESQWYGDWFCNPPFSQKDRWIEKCLVQRKWNSGILLLPERGSAPWFGPLAQKCGWYWVMGKKINFIGGPSSNNLGSVLFLFGPRMRERVLRSGLPGHLCEVSTYTGRS